MHTPPASRCAHSKVERENPSVKASKQGKQARYAEEVMNPQPKPPAGRSKTGFPILFFLHFLYLLYFIPRPALML